MANTISQKIDSYAKTHINELKQEEAKSGKKLTKYDIAQKMLSNSALSKSDFDSWVKTSEGAESLRLSEEQKTALKNGNVFSFAGGFAQESYLDSVSEFSIGNVLGFEKTSTGQIKSKPVEKKNFDINKQLKQTKVKAHIESVKLTEADKAKTIPELTREIEEQKENERFSKMTHDARKKHIMSKFLDARNKNDKGAMMSALGEFNSYMCQYIDEKLGITGAKQSIKEFVHLDQLVDYIDKNVDDGTDAISFMEGLWEVTKGVGDAVDSFIGAQGLEMAGVLGAASKGIQASGKLAPVLGGAMQAYFGVEGTMLMADGTEKIVNAETKEDVRAGGSEVGMGAIMVGGAVGSVRSGLKGRKANQEQAKFDNTAKEVANQYPEVSQRLAEYKTPDGKPLFTQEEINSVLVNCKKTIESNPEKLFAILNNPKEIADIIKYNNKAAGLWRAVNEPFPSTIEANPEVFGVKAKAKTEPAKATANKPAVTADMSVEAMKELAKTPEGVKQLEEAGLVITKNTVSKLENVYEGQSQSPARRIKKLDLTGTPEEVVAKNPGLKYDAEQGKFFREVSWDGGKTMERMYVDASDPKGYFMIQYGKEPWDGALLGGTEAAKSYVEPNAYNATGAKNYLKPEEMGYEWTEASKAAPVRFAEVPEGVKGIVGKEGFQPITGGDQVIAIDVKGQPYINTVDYVRNNTKGLSQNAVKVLDKVEGKTAQTTEAPATAKLSVSQELKAQLSDALKDVKYDKNEVLDMIDKYPEVVTRLAEYKTPNGESLFKPLEINDILFNCKNTIESNPEKLFAILNNPEEIASIVSYKNKALGLWRAVDDPFPSTIEANPEVFGVKAKAKTEPAKTAESTASSKPSVSQELKAQLSDALKDVKYDKNEVLNMIDKYPEVVTRLAEYKTPNGESLFKPLEINDILFNCKNTIESNPEILFAVLNNPKEIASIMGYDNRALGLWRAVGEPFPSAIKGNAVKLQETNRKFILGNNTTSPAYPNSKIMKNYAEANGYSIAKDNVGNFVLENAKGQIKEVITDRASYRYEYDSAGRLKSRIEYNKTGSPDGFIKYEYNNDVVMITCFEFASRLKEPLASATKINADGTSVAVDGGYRTITQAERKALKELDLKPLDLKKEPGAKQANLVDIKAEDIQSIDINSFNTHFENVAEHIANSTTTSIKGLDTPNPIKITLDAKGRTVSSEKLRFDDRIEYSDKYYNDKGEIIAAREYGYDRSTSTRTNLSKEIKYEDGVTYTKSYNKDGSIEYFEKSEKNVLRDGRPIEKVTKYDAKGKVIEVNIFSDKVGTIEWNPHLEQYMTR